MCSNFIVAVVKEAVEVLLLLLLSLLLMLLMFITFILQFLFSLTHFLFLLFLFPLKGNQLGKPQFLWFNSHEYALLSWIPYTMAMYILEIN